MLTNKKIIKMETHLDKKTLLKMDQRKRANLINCIGGFKSVCLIGTVDSNKNTNLAVFNSIIHIGANPSLIGFVIRPDSVERNTLSNILETNYYSINHLNESIYQKGHQTSARYSKYISEFTETELTPDYKNNFFAPFVKESLIQIGVQFKERINISLNNTILIIGEITEIFFPTICLGEDGFLNIEKAKTITCSGLDSYHSTSKLARLSYAKPNQKLHKLN
jgi:flavin reductase (DIM6/NTAB) family NADH-FMN oxidoreductase RutF